MIPVDELDKSIIGKRIIGTFFGEKDVTGRIYGYWDTPKNKVVAIHTDKVVEYGDHGFVCSQSNFEIRIDKQTNKDKDGIWESLTIIDSKKNPVQSLRDSKQLKYKIMKRVKDAEQPALIDTVREDNGNYICIWNMMGWWYSLTEYDNAARKHAPIGKQAYSSLEEARAAAEEFARGGMVSDSKKIKDGYYDNAKIAKLLFEIERKGKGSVVDEVYGMISQWCENMDECDTEYGLDFKNAEWSVNEQEIIDFLEGELKKISDSKKIKDEMDSIEIGDLVTTDHDDRTHEVVDIRNKQGRAEYLLGDTSGWWSRWQLTKVSDSKKIKDENTMDVLDGQLLVAFKDGTEEEGLKAVKAHTNESDSIDNVKYEVYGVDNSDGVAIIDLCATTSDPNAFVKTLLTKWDVLDKVADLEFEASEEMEEAVSDSRKVNDMTKPAHWRGYAESVRAKRRNKKDEPEEEENNEKQDITDSARISDSVEYTTDFSLTNPVNDRQAAREYLEADDMTKYLNNDLDYLGLSHLEGKIESIEWHLETDQYGYISLFTTEDLSKEDLAKISEWIKGQNSDGLGEGFEQQDFATIRIENDEDEYGYGDYDTDMASFDWKTNDYKLLKPEEWDAM